MSEGFYLVKCLPRTLKIRLGLHSSCLQKRKLRGELLFCLDTSGIQLTMSLLQGQTRVDVPGRKSRRLKTLKSTFRKIVRSLLNKGHGVKFKRGAEESFLDD